MRRGPDKCEPRAQSEGDDQVRAECQSGSPGTSSVDWPGLTGYPET